MSSFVWKRKRREGGFCENITTWRREWAEGRDRFSRHPPCQSFATRWSFISVCPIHRERPRRSFRKLVREEELVTGRLPCFFFTTFCPCHFLTAPEKVLKLSCIVPLFESLYLFFYENKKRVYKRAHLPPWFLSAAYAKNSQLLWKKNKKTKQRVYLLTTSHRSKGNSWACVLASPFVNLVTLNVRMSFSSLVLIRNINQ